MANENLIRLAPNLTSDIPMPVRKPLETAINLVRTSDLLVKRIADLVQPFDLTHHQVWYWESWRISERRYRRTKSRSNSSSVGLRSQSLINSLERRGYVRRSPPRTDRRMLLIELTDTGRQVAHDFRLLVHQHQKAWLAVLTERSKSNSLTLFIASSRPSTTLPQSLQAISIIYRPHPSAFSSPSLSKFSISSLLLSYLPNHHNLSNKLPSVPIALKGASHESPSAKMEALRAGTRSPL